MVIQHFKTPFGNKQNIAFSLFSEEVSALSKAANVEICFLLTTIIRGNKKLYSLPIKTDIATDVPLGKYVLCSHKMNRYGGGGSELLKKGE